MVFAAMSVFLSFIAALATSDSRSALMCVTVSCIHTEQNTLITWERDLEIKYTWVPGNKHGPVKHEARMPTMRCFFH